MNHTCELPDLATWPDYDEDWACAECKQDWFVDDSRCYECGRFEGARWEKYGTGDGTFPNISVARGGIQYARGAVSPAPAIIAAGGWCAPTSTIYGGTE